MEMDKYLIHGPEKVRLLKSYKEKKHQSDDSYNESATEEVLDEIEYSIPVEETKRKRKREKRESSKSSKKEKKEKKKKKKRKKRKIEIEQSEPIDDFDAELDRYYEEIIDLTSVANAVQEAQVEEDFERITITGIDPGPVNCGFVQIDAITGKVIKAKLVAFRRSGEHSSRDTLIESVKKFVELDKYKFFNTCYVVVESQEAEVCLENLAVQYSLQALLGTDKCTSIASNSWKADFREHFPILRGVTKSTQHYYNKKNATTAGRKLLSPGELKLFDTPKGEEHHLFDAYFIASSARVRWFSQ